MRIESKNEFSNHIFYPKIKNFSKMKSADSTSTWFQTDRKSKEEQFITRAIIRFSKIYNDILSQN